MLYLLYRLAYEPNSPLSFLRLFNYLTSRALFAAITSLAIVLIVGKPFIRWLYHRGFRDIPRTYGDVNPQSKSGTPTMGGLLIVGAILISVLLWCNLMNHGVLIMLGALLWFAIIGTGDDILKLQGKNSDAGLSETIKLALQAVFGLALGILYLSGWFNQPTQIPQAFNSMLFVPFIKAPILNLHWAYALFIVFVILAISNAVNFADGLDGLAIVPAGMNILVYGIIAYILGNKLISDYLNYPYIPGTGELMVFCSAVLGAAIGFLWFNCYPAQVFMGDVGSLTLGGLIATLAVLLKQEFLFVISGGIFVIEAASVLIQEKIGINRLGRRLLYRAPLHHTFQYLGMAESKVTIRFWIVSAILMILALGTVKIR